MLLRLTNIFCILSLLLAGSCATIDKQADVTSAPKIEALQIKTDPISEVCTFMENFGKAKAESQAAEFQALYTEDTIFEYKIELCKTLSDDSLGFATIHYTIVDNGKTVGEMQLAYFLLKRDGNWTIGKSEAIFVQIYENPKDLPEESESKDTDVKKMEL